MRIHGEITPGDERAHVDVVGEDIMSDQLTEQQHQIKELHLLVFLPRISWKDNTDSQGYQSNSAPL